MKTLLYISLFLCSVGFVSAQNSLYIPPVIEGSSTIELVIQEGTVEFFPGQTTNSMGINGQILAPTLIFDKGDYKNINITNQLSDSTTIHWHGMHVPSSMDGGPHTVVAPNSIWNPSFTVMDNASTMWYHPHLHHKTNKHVQMGVAGFIIIRDTIEASLNIPRTYGVDDIPVLIQTKTLDNNFQIDTDMANSGMDDLVLINATPDAFFDAPAQIVRLRLLNGASERSFNIGFSNNASFQVIASDGGLLESPVSMNRLLISNGERYEILIDLSDMEGQELNLMNYGSTMPSGIYGTQNLGMGGFSIPNYSSNPLNGADYILLGLHIGNQTENPIQTIVESLVPIDYINPSTSNVNRSITMSPVAMGPYGALNGPFQLNGQVFDMNVINETVSINATEIWSITNQSQVAHPFHIHDVQFNIIEINGNPAPLHKQGWKDVVLVPAQQGNVKFIAKFEDFADSEIPYMYHCHILTHEDGGMMGQFLVEGESALVGPSNQLITIPEGWSSISTYIHPLNSDIIELFSEISDQIIIVKDYSGSAYLPSWDFNGIGDLTIGQGYQVKSIISQVLDVSGVYSEPSLNAIQLSPGWNLIGFLPLQAQNTQLVFENVNVFENLLIVKDDLGNAYLPSWDFNGIGDMIPGEGYQVKVLETDYLIYQN
jgi:blue copper oxidase